jgi:L-cystine transport system permease protein
MQEWFDWDLLLGFLPTLMAFLPVTLLIFLSAVLVGGMLGCGLALPRLYKVPYLQKVSVIVVSYTRGTPILVQLMIAYYILPDLLSGAGFDVADVSALYFVIAAYALSMGANFSEVIRGAIGSIERGQIEAADSIGMTQWQALRRIIVPQAFVVAIPDVCNILMQGLKSTSLAFTVGVMDIVGRGQALGAQTMRFFEVYVALAIIYYGLNLILEHGFAFAERHFGQYLGRASQTGSAW